VTLEEDAAAAIGRPVVGAAVFEANAGKLQAFPEDDRKARRRGYVVAVTDSAIHILPADLNVGGTRITGRLLEWDRAATHVHGSPYGTHVKLALEGPDGRLLELEAPRARGRSVAMIDLLAGEGWARRAVLGQDDVPETTVRKVAGVGLLVGAALYLLASFVPWLRLGGLGGSTTIGGVDLIGIGYLWLGGFAAIEGIAPLAGWAYARRMGIGPILTGGLGTWFVIRDYSDIQDSLRAARAEFTVVDWTWSAGFYAAVAGTVVILVAGIVIVVAKPKFPAPRQTPGQPPDPLPDS
jgi:hypothetical protein